MLVIKFQSRATAGFLRSAACVASLGFIALTRPKLSLSEKSFQVTACYDSQERLSTDHFCVYARFALRTWP